MRTAPRGTALRSVQRYFCQFFWIRFKPTLPALFTSKESVSCNETLARIAEYVGLHTPLVRRCTEVGAWQQHALSAKDSSVT